MKTDSVLAGKPLRTHSSFLEEEESQASVPRIRPKMGEEAALFPR